MSKEKNRKNRMMGLIVMEIRRGIEIVKEEKMDGRSDVESDKVRGEEWRIVGVCVNEDL